MVAHEGKNFEVFHFIVIYRVGESILQLLHLWTSQIQLEKENSKQLSETDFDTNTSWVSNPQIFHPISLQYFNPLFR